MKPTLFLKACTLSLLILLAAFADGEHSHKSGVVELDCVICLHATTATAVDSGIALPLALAPFQPASLKPLSLVQLLHRHGGGIRAPPYAA
ncbi:hypothetical protein NO559_07360 [Dasania sp. GY-MA-18]|uniref:Secreted protein n=1 Tax=Dasania phycosphaerae TaxID=2950436 RepID=A0A9J6RJZ7_9GAMM|nr:MULTISPECIES: hypothetical protein [Dasania]MCR8922585.1 hypothetical protein [Dasania sp. GY-MA-18]MCZ0865014.1 hypothetical protein [Dasania phycosphaerae]MCZ0868741.1 hypothetical protein [Dasania phycosphaerae]